MSLYDEADVYHLNILGAYRKVQLKKEFILSIVKEIHSLAN